MAAAVMTRYSTKPAAGTVTRKTRANAPPRLQLSNGAASRDGVHASLAHSCDGDYRDRSHTHTGGGGERRRVERGVVIGKGGKERGVEVGRERSSRVVLNGELVESQLSPETEESICQVFSFDTKASDFEESMSQVWPLRCSFIVRELIETERTYVQALGEIIKGYITPLYSYLLSSGDGPNFIRTVFSNIGKIHCYHLDLLDSFQSLGSQPKELVQLFLDRDFNLYTEYCTNYSKGNDYLEQSLGSSADLQAFIQECQANLDHSLPLHSHLIKPVQRILKYPLLLEELVKNFEDTHSAYSTVEEACKKMTEVAEHINSSFQKPAKKSRLAPSAIARLRSKEVEGLQRRRTITPLTSPKSPTSKSLTVGRSKRSSSVETGDIIGARDRVSPRNHRKRRNRKGHGRRHMSVEDLYPDEHATTSSSEEDHLARVGDLKTFFENLNKTDHLANATKSPVMEVAQLDLRKWSMFESPASLETVNETVPKSPALEVAPLELSKWSMFEKPSTSETGGDSKKTEGHGDKKGRTHSEHKKTSRSPQPSTRTTPSSTAKGAGKEHGKPKGSRKKRDS